MSDDARRIPDAARVRLLQAIEELAHHAGEFLSPPLVRHLDEARDRLAAARFNLVVLAEFKRGKSTLINALLGQQILPTDVVPLTSAVTIIRHGPRARLIVRFQGGRKEEHAISELHRFATERGNPENRVGVDSTMVEIPAGLLASGMQLVDRPGIGSVYEHNTAAARGFLPRGDVAVCVLAADQPLAQSERERFVDIADRVPRLLVVVNKIDHLRREERGVAVHENVVREQLTPDRLRDLCGERSGGRGDHRPCASDDGPRRGAGCRRGGVWSARDRMASDT